MPFAIYFDFETTFGKKTYHFDDDASMYPVLCAFVVAFHLTLNLDRTFVVRSFNHTFEQLNDVSYLSDEIIPYFDPITVRQLRDSSQAVFEKREKFSISQMFYRKLKFVIDLLIK